MGEGSKERSHQSTPVHSIQQGGLVPNTLPRNLRSMREEFSRMRRREREIDRRGETETRERGDRMEAQEKEIGKKESAYL